MWSRSSAGYRSDLVSPSVQRGWNQAQHSSAANSKKTHARACVPAWESFTRRAAPPLTAFLLPPLLPPAEVGGLLPHTSGPLVTGPRPSSECCHSGGTLAQCSSVLGPSAGGGAKVRSLTHRSTVPKAGVPAPACGQGGSAASDLAGVRRAGQVPEQGPNPGSAPAQPGPSATLRGSGPSSARLRAFISLCVNLGGTSWAWARRFPYSISHAEPPSRHAQRLRARPRADGHWRPRFTSLCLGLLACTTGKWFLPARATLKLTFV